MARRRASKEDKRRSSPSRGASWAPTKSREAPPTAPPKRGPKRAESEWDRRAREGRERQRAEREADERRRRERPASEWDRRARAARKEREKERKKRQRAAERERKRLAKLKGPFNRALRQKEREREERRKKKKEEREAAAEPAELPQLPRRSKRRPKVFRDEGGRFAPADRRGLDEAGWVPVWSAGWQRADGSTAASYSSLRELPDWERYYERLVVAGRDDRGDVDPSSEEWKRVAREIAAEIGVHVQEVYTLGLSP